jgi:hypothetical protein
VAILVDSRTNQASDLNNAIAITALGTIEEVAAHNKDYLSGIYLSKHPQLTTRTTCQEYIYPNIPNSKSFSISHQMHS